MIIDMVKQEMDAAMKHLDHAFQKIRAGRASTTMVQDVMVEYYGAPTPINQVANVMVPDAMTISIQPWDRTAIGAIEKAIINSNLGFAPMNNGENIILNVPPLTEERRRELTKVVKKLGEDAKVAIRNIRRDMTDGLNKVEKGENLPEDMVKDNQDKIQKLTDKYTANIDSAVAVKEKEVMTV